MSQYTLLFDWSQKEANADVIDGDDYNGEFEAVRTAVNSKVDTVPSPTSGNLVKTDGTGAVLDSGLQTDKTPQLDDTNTWTATQDFAADSSMAGDKLTNFPAGTLMLFQQTSAPTGWTKQVTHNNKALRVVNGTANSGGTLSFTSAFSSARTTSNDTHSHTYSGTTSNNSANTTSQSGSQTGKARDPHTHTYSGTTSSDTHGHTLALDVEYVDFIIAQKDA